MTKEEFDTLRNVCGRIDELYSLLFHVKKNLTMLENGCHLSIKNGFNGEYRVEDYLSEHQVAYLRNHIIEELKLRRDELQGEFDNFTFPIKEETTTKDDTTTQRRGYEFL